MWVLFAAALLAPVGDRCDRPLVDKVETARAIAEAVLAERGLPVGGKGLFGTPLLLSVEPDLDDRRYWSAAVYEEGAQGGGAYFRIRRCDGAITGWTYTR